MAAPAMNGPHVYNRAHASKVPLPAGAVYVGRPSKWGNPFRMGRDGARDEVVRKFRRHMEQSPELRSAARRELRGKNLVCWCAPAPCHADVILEIANSGDGED